MDEDCVFCRIVTGDQDAHRVYEDDETLAFLDVNAAVEGHTLIIPKVHRRGLTNLDEETVAALFEATRTVATAIENALSSDGYSLFHSSGAAAGQDVFHAHVHLFPRFEDDNISFAPPRRRLSETEGEQIAARIRSGL